MTVGVAAGDSEMQKRVLTTRIYRAMNTAGPVKTTDCVVVGRQCASLVAVIRASRK
jgi:hypothetical protein